MTLVSDWVAPAALGGFPVLAGADGNCGFNHLEGSRLSKAALPAQSLCSILLLRQLWCHKLESGPLTQELSFQSVTPRDEEAEP